MIAEKRIPKEKISFIIYRGYSRATAGGGAVVESTSSGGGTSVTSSSGGGTTATSSSGGGTSTSTQSGGGTSNSTNNGGGTTQTSSSGGDHEHTLFIDNGSRSEPTSGYRSVQFNDGSTGGTLQIAKYGTGNIRTYSSSGDHTHSVTVPSHSHSFTVPSHSHNFNTPNHTHSVTIPNHSHGVSIPNHTHNITLPSHTHEINHGIYNLDVLPTNVTIEVDGNAVPFSGTSADELDLIPYLAKDSNGKILRGQWHEVTLTPNALSRINANIISRMFIQSDLGGKY